MPHWVESARQLSWLAAKRLDSSYIVGLPLDVANSGTVLWVLVMKEGWRENVRLILQCSGFGYDWFEEDLMVKHSCG